MEILLLKRLYESKSPQSLAFFAWKKIRKKFLMTKKKFENLWNNLCMSKSSKEIVDHLFLRCDITREMWTRVLFVQGGSTKNAS